MSSGEPVEQNQPAAHSTNDVSRTVLVPNSQGLHARPVMRFVDLANRFHSAVHVQRGDRRVDGKNPMEMMLLEAIKGTSLEILAQGEDAEEAVSALAELVETGFGES